MGAPANLRRLHFDIMAATVQLDTVAERITQWPPHSQWETTPQTVRVTAVAAVAGETLRLRGSFLSSALVIFLFGALFQPIIEVAQGPPILDSIYCPGKYSLQDVSSP